MGAGLVRARRCHLRGGPGAEGAARGGEQDPADPGLPRNPRSIDRQALVDGVVFAVDGQQQRAGIAHRLHQKVPRHDQGFLVRQQHPLAGAGRCQRGGQAGGANDGGHDRIHIGVGGHLAQAGLAAQHGSPQLRRQACSQGLGRVRAQHDREARPVLQALAMEGVDGGVGGEGIHPIAIRVARDHIQGILADGPGGTQNADSLQHLAHKVTTPPTAGPGRTPAPPRKYCPAGRARHRDPAAGTRCLSYRSRA